MAVRKDIDGLLLIFNNQFLINLRREKYTLSNIRFKFIVDGRPPMYRTFKDYDEFYEYYLDTLDDSQLNCLVGRFMILESIKLVNGKLNFPNSYYVRTIPSLLQIQENFKLDNFRKEFNTSQTALYNKYLYKRFTDYITDINNLINFRKDLYIESCWINPDYFKSEYIQLLTV